MGWRVQLPPGPPQGPGAVLRYPERRHPVTGAARTAVSTPEHRCESREPACGSNATIILATMGSQGAWQVPFVTWESRGQDPSNSRSSCQGVAAVTDE